MEDYDFEIRNSHRIMRKELDKHSDWAAFVVDQVLELFPDLEVYTMAAGISPSGVVHFGNFRDIAVSLAVKLELDKRGKKTRFVFSWDDFDRFRKVPKGMPEDFKQYIGLPLAEVPDPSGEYESYAKKNELVFEESMKALDIELEYKYQTELHRAGTYVEGILTALKKREDIARILLMFMSGKSKEKRGIVEEDFVRDYYPIGLYSRFTGKDAVEVLSFDGESKVKYRCLITDQEDEVDLREYHNVKLAWKIDWPMRWAHEGVVFEPGGKDHATPYGSYDVSCMIAEAVYDLKSPVFVGYDFIGLQGLQSKMSSSAGNALSPGELLEVYTPELLLWIYERAAPQKPFNLAFDSEIIRQYDEFDRAFPGEAPAIPFRQAVGFGQVVNWDEARLKEMLEGLGEDFVYSEESISVRLPRARAWLENYNQDQMIALLEEVNKEHFDGMSEEAKGLVARLVEELKAGPKSVSEWNEVVYGIPKEGVTDEDEMKQRQRAFFKDVYQLLFGKNRGPRLATYLWAVEPEVILERLDLA